MGNTVSTVQVLNCADIEITPSVFNCHDKAYWSRKTDADNDIGYGSSITRTCECEPEYPNGCQVRIKEDPTVARLGTAAGWYNEYVYDTNPILVVTGSSQGELEFMKLSGISGGCDNFRRGRQLVDMMNAAAAVEDKDESVTELEHLYVIGMGH